MELSVFFNNVIIILDSAPTDWWNLQFFFNRAFYH